MKSHVIQADLHLICSLGTIQKWLEIALPTLAAEKQKYPHNVSNCPQNIPQSQELWCINLFQHILTFSLFCLKTRYIEYLHEILQQHLAEKSLIIGSR